MFLLAVVLLLVLAIIVRKQHRGQAKAAEAEMHMLAVEVSRISWAVPGANLKTGPGGGLKAAIRVHASVPADDLLTDPWGTPYLVSCDGTALVIFTPGPDGKWGVAESDSDNAELVAAVSTGKATLSRGKPPSFTPASKQPAAAGR